MKIFVKARTGTKEEGVVKTDDLYYQVSVKARPRKGEANRAIVKQLAKFFGVAQSRVVIKAGHTAKTKIVEIDIKS